mgnify:CR=1 FL=1|tara:strand:+ start:3274 stop:3693 length:420 start_codon:yes stop_codon:yes gene_type:complete
MTSVYAAHATIDLDRQKSDLMYHLIVNTEASTLDDLCKQIAESVLKRYAEPSIRLKKMLAQVTSDQDRIAKHALLLFALYQEDDTMNIFFDGDTPRVPPEKFQIFVEQELPTLVDKLMKGAFTSLRAFVEDARWTYITL